MRIIYTLIVTSIVGTSNLEQQDRLGLTGLRRDHGSQESNHGFRRPCKVIEAPLNQTISFCPRATIFETDDCMFAIPPIPKEHEEKLERVFRDAGNQIRCIDPRDFPKERIQHEVLAIQRVNIRQIHPSQDFRQIEFSCGSNIGYFAAIPRLSPLTYSRSFIGRMKDALGSNYRLPHDFEGYPTKISYDTLKKYCAALKLTGDYLRS